MASREMCLKILPKTWGQEIEKEVRGRSSEGSVREYDEPQMLIRWKVLIQRR